MSPFFERKEAIKPLSLESGMIYTLALLVFLIGIGLGGLDGVNHSNMGSEFNHLVESIILPIVVQSSVSTTP